MRILVVDDEPKHGRLVAEMLSVAGHSVDRAGGGREAVSALSATPYELVITDLRMPEVDGLAVLRAAKQRGTPPEVVVMTAHGSAESAVAAMKAGAADYLTKPFSMDELRLRVARIAAQREAETRSERLVERLVPSLVAESPAMRSVLEAARQVARTDATVLILGESGTGKSQLARFIHYTSARRDAALIEVHCAALTETLLESELFGHERGAFSGAEQRKDGLLGTADKGTLFLDEIGEVPPATQVKLLRFLQEREFVPVGSTRARRVDVRVIAATNRDLEGAVRAGAFRQDLYYRLHVFPLETPPLRVRREDVLPLAERALSARGSPPSKLSPEARQALLAHAWPGNVRELENALERALILAGSGAILPEHLWSAPAQGRSAPGLAGASLRQLLDRLIAPEPGTGAEGFNLDGFERDLLTAAIERTGGNKAAAARLLGITRRRLYSRLKSLNERMDGPDAD